VKVTLTIETVDKKRDDRQCPHCNGSGFSGRDADEDGDFGLPCPACHTSGEATHCPSCTLAGAPPEEVFRATYEITAQAGTTQLWRRSCVRHECVGTAVAELHGAMLAASRPGLAHTRPEAAKEQTAC
jgi:hypothetical protein